MKTLKTQEIKNILSSSFRDPSGFLFYQNETLYRQINRFYQSNYEHLTNSGLYEELSGAGLLIPHVECDINISTSADAYKIIKPEVLSFVSYPYEWCYSQLKDAAITTLRIQKRALEFGMSLKDCSAYNIQFRNGKPILIDTLSFEKYREGLPWIAYRQFCQHFLAPLALMSYKDVRLSQLLRIYIDGIPIDLASSLLPLRSWFKFSMLYHIHLHAKSQKRFAKKSLNRSSRQLTHHSFLGLIDNLESLIKGLKWKDVDTEWVNYYQDTNYSPTSFQHKKEIVRELVRKVGPKNVWDFGANIGVFSRISTNLGIPTISFDFDLAAVESNYLNCIKDGDKNLLPLVLDLTNPSPGIGWQNVERMSLIDRAPTSLAIALALIHHLAISNNLPFDKIANFFSDICYSLIIEFVPKSDSQVQRLLSFREDIFVNYTRREFVKKFNQYFKVTDVEEIKESERVIYLFEKR